MSDWIHLFSKHRAALDAAAHIFTWTGTEELVWLAEQASTRHPILEIGTYKGHSAVVLAESAGSVVCFDYCPESGVSEEAQRNLAPYVKSGRLTYIQRDAGVSAVHYHLTAQPRFKMIWIDNGHTYADVVRDCLIALLLGTPDAFICGHDYEVAQDGSAHNDVAKAVDACFGHNRIKKGPGTIWYL